MKVVEQFLALKTEGTFPDKAYIRMYGDGSGSVYVDELLGRAPEARTVTVRTRELAVFAEPDLWLEQGPFPFRDVTRPTGWVTSG